MEVELLIIAIIDTQASFDSFSYKMRGYCYRASYHTASQPLYLLCLPEQ
jgi:hypothetical protein